MLHIEDKKIRELLLKGKFGFELESHRVTNNGHLAHTTHPFPGDSHLSRDFSEDQIEINTDPYDTAEEAVAAMEGYVKEVQEALFHKEEREFLWPFSNPPYLIDENDIRVAQYEGEARANTEYREFLSQKYGRYLMTYAGIHVNYSFDDELLARNAELEGKEFNQEYKNQFYIDLSEKAAAYGWILVALMAASPVLDSSFFQKGQEGETLFTGMASPRCSELGYWNQFTPMFDYTSLEHYIRKMESYVETEMLIAARELYYPIRVKPPGLYSVEALREKGISHIELRMYDLDPFSKMGLNLKDTKFAQLFLVWLASFDIERMTGGQQTQAAQNFKNAAHYDVDTAKVNTIGIGPGTVRESGIKLLEKMRNFYCEFDPAVRDLVEYQMDKMTLETKRYAPRVRMLYGDDFVRSGMRLARARQEKILGIEG